MSWRELIRSKMLIVARWEWKTIGQKLSRLIISSLMIMDFHVSIMSVRYRSGWPIFVVEIWSTYPGRDLMTCGTSPSCSPVEVCSNGIIRHSILAWHVSRQESRNSQSRGGGTQRCQDFNTFVHITGFLMLVQFWKFVLFDFPRNSLGRIAWNGFILSITVYWRVICRLEFYRN